MTTIDTIDDSMGSRSRRKINCVLIPSQGILPFEGKSITPVVRVLREDYMKNGKWSHSSWEVETFHGAKMANLRQDWETGHWFPVNTWSKAVKYFRDHLHVHEKVASVDESVLSHISDDMIVQFIRAVLPKSASDIDAREAEWEEGANSVSELLAAQAELVKAQAELAQVETEIRQREEADRIKEEAKRLSEVAVKAACLLESGGKMTLADLKRLVG